MTAQLPADAKRFSTAAARCALLGVTLSRIEGDFVPELYVLTRWQMTLQFTRLQDVEDWLNVLQGAPA